jgi:hypothetical protein
MEKPDESHTEEEQERNRLLSIDIRRVNAPLKSAKVLVDRGYGCESGSEGTTISIKVVKGSGQEFLIRTQHKVIAPCLTRPDKIYMYGSWQWYIDARQR